MNSSKIEVGDIIVGCDIGTGYNRDCIIEAVGRDFLIIRGNQSVSKPIMLVDEELAEFYTLINSRYEFVSERGEWFPA